MLPALLGATVPVAVGAGLALLPGRRPDWMIPARALAFGAALVVVVTVLVPAAWPVLGPWAIVGVLLAAVVPIAVERRFPSEAAEDAGVELALLGVLVHQLVEGFEVGLAFSLDQAAWALTGAVAVHTVPVVAAVVLAVQQHKGLRAAAIRSVALLVATATGVVLASFFIAIPDAFEAVALCVAGGLLLHVLGHQGATDRHQHPRGSLPWFVVGVGLAGLAILLLPHG